MDSVELVARLKELDVQAGILDKEADGFKTKAKEHAASADGKRAEMHELLRQYDGPQAEIDFKPPDRDTVIAADPECRFCKGSGVMEGENHAQVTCVCLEAALERVRGAERVTVSRDTADGPVHETVER